MARLWRILFLVVVAVSLATGNPAWWGKKGDKKGEETEGELEYYVVEDDAVDLQSEAGKKTDSSSSNSDGNEDKIKGYVKKYGKLLAAQALGGAYVAGMKKVIKEGAELLGIGDNDSDDKKGDKNDSSNSHDGKLKKLLHFH